MRIVRESYPVADLPKDLRADLPNVQRVRLVIEPIIGDAHEQSPTSLEQLFARSKRSYRNFGEVVDRVEALRAGWD